MKKVFIFLMCLLGMMGASLSAKAQEITITLNPGWTWISYTNAEAMDIATALGDFTPMSGDIINSQYGSTSYTGGRWRGSLTHFIPGWGYMYYSTRTDYAELVFAQPSSNAVATAMPTDITDVSAVVGGMVSVPEGGHVFQRGVCWGTMPSPDIDGDHTTEETGIGSFSSTLVGLNPSTTYYVRAYAASDYGLAYGNELSFTTLSGIPVVTTSEVTDITGNSAFCGGTVTDDGGLAITARGVCWSTSHNPTLSNNHTSDGTGTGSFTSSLTGLGTSTTYYVRAYATTAQATSYGEEMTFTTMSGIPTVSTAEVTDITATTATCGGTIATDGGLAITARGVCWSTSHNPTLSDSHTTDGTGTGSFTSTITGLSASTTYYVRAYASNSLVTIYGGEQSFTTEAGGGSGDDHAYVDLGLPSGTLWATCNIGANAPEDYGDYIIWDEYVPAMYNWSSFWHMPTIEEFEELLNNTTVTWTQQNGVNGRLFTATNGNSLFLPAAGYSEEGDHDSKILCGEYWSSSLGSDIPGDAWYLYFDSVDCGMFYDGGYDLLPMRSVRLVRSSVQNVPSYTITVSANPNDGGSVSGDGTYEQGQNCTVTTIANSSYVFTNWTENGEVVSTDATYTFAVDGNRNLVANFEIPTIDDHAYVDLGLPSGTLWAICNVGADIPEDYGDYFAWGETQPKDSYNWSTYQYCNGGEGWNTLTKYCDEPVCGYNGFTDNLTTLLPEDDAATANWGSDWHMPTEEEWQELLDNTTVIWTTQNGVNGRLFIASNGNSIFLPAAGSLYSAGSNGLYWSSSLFTGGPHTAWTLYFYSDNYFMNTSYRIGAQSVRPVRSASQNTAPTGAINGKFTINADGDQVYFSQGNLQYQASTNTWRFAENQYDFVGGTLNEGSEFEEVFGNVYENGIKCSNNRISSEYSGWIDLFGWGTSGYNHGAVCYQPWSISDNYGDYYAYGIWGSNLNDQTGQADWGYNAISNGGNQENQWRTLTGAEWRYILFDRNTVSDARYVKAKVNDVNGIVLLPDDWSLSFFDLSDINDDNSDFSSNIISSANWIDNLEVNGAVFLPSTGSRERTSYSMTEDNIHGLYWSSSVNSYRWAAFDINFADGYLFTYPDHAWYFCDGISVRLVHNTE